MGQVEHTLYERLGDHAIPLATREKLVEYLKSLNKESAPDWYLLQKLNEHLIKLLQHHLHRLFSASHQASREAKGNSEPPGAGVRGLLFCVEDGGGLYGSCATQTLDAAPTKRRWSKIRNLVRMGALSYGLMHERREAASDLTTWG